MEIKLERKDRKLHFIGTNKNGFQVEFDSSASGYNAEAPSPMEVVLMSAASCSAIDAVLILEKMKQKLDDIKISVKAERPESGEVKPFAAIHLHYDLFGEIEESKAKRALELSVEKYCSVLEMLKSTAKISHSFNIVSK